MKRFDLAVRWRTGTVSFVPSLRFIAASQLTCLPSSPSGITIGWLAVACIKDKALSCVLAWQSNLLTGWLLWAIPMSHLPSKHTTCSSLLNRKSRASLPKFGFGLGAFQPRFASLLPRARLDSFCLFLPNNPIIKLSTRFDARLSLPSIPNKQIFSKGQSGHLEQKADNLNGTKRTILSPTKKSRQML